MPKPVAIVSGKRRSEFSPADVCGVRVDPALIKLYWLNEVEEALIEHVATKLDPACDGALALAAVKARFAAVAEWATRRERVASLPHDLSDDAVLQALALAPLRFVHGAYRFNHREFGAALRGASSAEATSAPTMHLH